MTQDYHFGDDIGMEVDVSSLDRSIVKRTIRPNQLVEVPQSLQGKPQDGQGYIVITTAVRLRGTVRIRIDDEADFKSVTYGRISFGETRRLWVVQIGDSLWRATADAPAREGYSQRRRRPSGE